MFENGIKKEKKMFFVLSRAWEKEKNSESPRGVEPQTFGFPRSDAIPLSHKDSMVSEAHYKCSTLCFRQRKLFSEFKTIVDFCSFFLFQINCFILVSVIYVLLRKTMVKAGEENSARKSSIRYIKRNNLELTAWTIYLVKVAASL